jgi:hypothetical protein
LYAPWPSLNPLYGSPMRRSGFGFSMRVSWRELQETFEFASFGQPGETEAVLCRQSGKCFWHSDAVEDIEAWPEDADDEEKYLRIPHKKELDLGKALVFDFAAACLPDAFDEVRQIFNRRGAYARFRDLLHRKKALDRWYAFEAEATEKALRQWCEDNDITIDEGSDETTRPEQSS